MKELLAKRNVQWKRTQSSKEPLAKVAYCDAAKLWYRTLHKAWNLSIVFSRHNPDLIFM